MKVIVGSLLCCDSTLQMVNSGEDVLVFYNDRASFQTLIQMMRSERDRMDENSPLLYHIHLVELLAVCTEGKNVYTEIKCNSLLPLDDIVRVVTHEDCIPEVGMPSEIICTLLSYHPNILLYPLRAKKMILFKFCCESVNATRLSACMAYGCILSVTTMFLVKVHKLVCFCMPLQVKIAYINFLNHCYVDTEVEMKEIYTSNHMWKLFENFLVDICRVSHLQHLKKRDDGKCGSSLHCIICEGEYGMRCLT